MFPPCRDLTLDDVKDIENMNGTPLDILAAVACRAKEILDDHVAKLQETKGKAKNTYEEGDPSTPTPPKKIKCKLSPPPLPEEFHRRIREMAGEKQLEAPRLVIQKSLLDPEYLSRSQHRLIIPMSKIRDDFLTEEEKSSLVFKRKNYMEVRMIEPSLGVGTVKFNRRDIPKTNGGETSSCYVINGTWSAIFKRNKLNVNMEVQLWSFRVDRKLWFALVRLPH